MALPPERQAALRAAKLSALVTARGVVVGPPAAPDRPTASTFPGGAALVADGQGWVLADEGAARALGPALAWAHRQGIGPDRLNLVADQAAGGLARRAAAFELAPRVWRVVGTDLAVAEPEPLPMVAPAGVPDGARALATQLEVEGVDVVVEHGDIIGEVAGLEVARIVVTHDDGGGDHGLPAARLEVGVGRHDREAFAIVHADKDPAAALAHMVATVRAQRRPGAAPHPLNRLGAHRWLRAVLVARPEVVGAAELVAVAGIDPRPGVKDTAAVAAVGTDAGGRSTVVVTSVGIDLDLVPSAADLRLAHAPGARLILAVPERDAHAATRRLAAQLVERAEVIAVPPDWRDLA